MNQEKTELNIPRILVDQDAYCYNLDQEYKCMAYNHMDCHKDCPARIGSLSQLRKLYQSLLPKAYSVDAKFYKDQIEQISVDLQKERQKQIAAAYYADTHRGSKRGGSSESDSNARASIKQAMKDNRSQECKWTHSEKEKIKTLTEEWEAEHGKLPKLPRSMLSRGTKKEEKKEKEK